MPIWAGPIQKAPWWWSQIVYHETRLQQISELAALDDEHEPPPRDYWYSGAKDELDEWIQQRTDKHKKDHP